MLIKCIELWLNENWPKVIFEQPNTTNYIIVSIGKARFHFSRVERWIVEQTLYMSCYPIPNDIKTAFHTTIDISDPGMFDRVNDLILRSISFDAKLRIPLD